MTERVTDRKRNVLADYRYLADGTKIGVTNEYGDGYEYLGSLIYRHTPSGLELESTDFSGGRIDRTTTGYRVKYFVRDYLGSVRAIADERGQRIESMDYMPFGSRWNDPQRLVTDNRYRYNGKEWQSTGRVNLLDYGARMYDPNLGRWFGQDPKYQFMNPYQFCHNNPILYIDPDGKILLVRIGNEVIDYIPGMTYTGMNSQIRNTIGILNKIYEFGGRKALEALVRAKNFKYEITDGTPGNALAKASFIPKGLYAGKILAGIINEINGTNIESLAHELFHAVQHLNGQGGASIFNEVEAYVFSYGILVNGIYGGSSCGVGVENSSQGAKWEDAFIKLYYLEYTWENMHAAVSSFKQGSEANSSGLYKDLVLYPPHPRTKQLQSMLQKYWTPISYL